MRCCVKDKDSRTRDVKEGTTAQGNWGIENYRTRAGDKMLNEAHPKNVIGEANSMSDLSAAELGTAPPSRYQKQFLGIVPARLYSCTKSDYSPHIRRKKPADNETTVKITRCEIL
jgi:hypothetical protein